MLESVDVFRSSEKEASLRVGVMPFLYLSVPFHDLDRCWCPMALRTYQTRRNDL